MFVYMDCSWYKILLLSSSDEMQPFLLMCFLSEIINHAEQHAGDQELGIFGIPKEYYPWIIGGGSALLFLGLGYCFCCRNAQEKPVQKRRRRRQASSAARRRARSNRARAARQSQGQRLVYAQAPVAAPAAPQRQVPAHWQVMYTSSGQKYYKDPTTGATYI